MSATRRPHSWILPWTTRPSERSPSDAMAVLDTDPSSPAYGQVVGWSERGEMGQERRYSWTAHRLPSGSSKNR
jgi:hypothetical protein